MGEKPMMHNSLLIRERLEETNNSELHKSRRDAHKACRRLDSSEKLADGEFALVGPWSIVTAGDRISGMDEACSDLEDFFIRSGIEIGESINSIALQIDEDIPEGAFRRLAMPGNLVIAASDMQGLWAGIVYLEKELAIRGAPVLTSGTIERSSSWKVQISQAPFGSNYLVPDLSDRYLSDDAFRLLAHSGINGMTIYGDWLLYVNSDRYPELNCSEYARNISMLKDASLRAQKYGIRLFYVPVGPKLVYDHPLFERVPEARGARINVGLKQDAAIIHNLCTSHPETLAFHGEVMANLFKEVPELGGLILIIGGESYYHCFMRPDKTNLAADQKTNCQQCAPHPPEAVVNGLLKATADAVRRQKPNAWIMAWPYSATIWSCDQAQIELLQEMDPQLALLSTIDKDQWAQKNGYQKLIWDYSVDYTGPADNLLNQSETLADRNMELFVKTETAIGLECIHYPYFPSLQRHAEKWKHVASMKPTGVLQSWMFFGMWGSRAEELGWWTAWHPEKGTEEVLAAIAARDFGPIASDMVKVWERLSEAASHFPCIPPYFTGPEFIGPAHPLLFGDEVEKRKEFEALLYYLQENEQTFSDTVNEVAHTMVMEALPYEHIRSVMRTEDESDCWPLFMSEYECALLHSQKAFEHLNHLQLPEDSVIQASFQEEKYLCEFIYRTFESIVNTYKFLEQKERGNLAGMVEIAEQELLNARLSRSIFIACPWLDLSLRVDGKYPSSLKMIDTKITIMEQEIKEIRSVPGGR